MYNKSEIMKRAWELYRTAKRNEKTTWFLGEMVVFNKASFSVSLKEAWATAKHEIKVEQEASANGMVRASKLQAGDIITIEYGDYNNFVTCTVESVEVAFEYSRYFANVKATADSREFNLSTKADEFVKVIDIAVPAVETVAA